MADDLHQEIHRAREELWTVFSEGAWEQLEVDVPDSLYDEVASGFQQVFHAYCQVLGHADNSYGQCVYCREDLRSSKNRN